MNENSKKKCLRVWHIPQIPMVNPFYVYVNSVEEAITIINTLNAYDAFQFNNYIKPDYSSSNGLHILEKQGCLNMWNEWYDEETGKDIHEIMNNK